MIKELQSISKSKTRVGRGISAGKGKTAGRGTKGQNSRSGHKRYKGFGSGSLPYAQRLPKFAGIKPMGQKITLTTEQIDAIITEKTKLIDRKLLTERGLIPGNLTIKDTVKIVAGKEKQKMTYNLGIDVKASKTVKAT